MGAPSQLFRNRNLPRCTGVEPVLMRHAILYREKTRTISRYGRARLCRKNKKPSGLARSVGTNLVHQKAASNWEGERPTGVQNRPVSGGISATQPHKGNRIIRILERAMGIEPNADCLEATEYTSFLLSPLEHFGTQPRLLSRRLRGEHPRERGHRPQE